MKKITKRLTLLLFISLVSGFVAYRSGWFGEKVQALAGSPNGSALNHVSDTVPKPDSTKRVKFLPSSKVLILKEPLKNSKKNSVADTTGLRPAPRTFFPGSKSAAIVKPADLPKALKDTIATDSTRKK